MIRRNTKIVKRFKSQLSINNSIKGDSIEVMLERLKEGEGVDGIEERDLVYNDGESGMVNPITNIRSDKNELMLEEKIGEYEHKHRTLKVHKPEEENKEENKEETPTDKTGE